MNLLRMTNTPDPKLAAALARFEEQFTYPLGPGRSFRISHGDDYPRFFRAIGDAACFVAERNGEVFGVLSLAITRIRTADGSERLAVYLGDLKLSPTARYGGALYDLVQAAIQWCSNRATCGFAVVMDGTPITPGRYTGRFGIPHFREVAKVAVLRIPATGGQVETNLQIDQAAGLGCYSRLTAGRIGTNGGNAYERSETPPQWLALPDGSACGQFEDTRRAKRLFSNGGSEMLAGHLSCIGYRNHTALVELLRSALGIACSRNLPALFAAIPSDEAADLVAMLGLPGIIVAPATIYATGVEPGQPWSIHTSEI